MTLKSLCRYDFVNCPLWTTPLHLAAYAGNTDTSMEILQHYLERRDTMTVSSSCLNTV